MKYYSFPHFFDFKGTDTKEIEYRYTNKGTEYEILDTVKLTVTFTEEGDSQWEGTVLEFLLSRHPVDIRSFLNCILHLQKTNTSDGLLDYIYNCIKVMSARKKEQKEFELVNLIRKAPQVIDAAQLYKRIRKGGLVGLDYHIKRVKKQNEKGGYLHYVRSTRLEYYDANLHLKPQDKPCIIKEKDPNYSFLVTKEFIEENDITLKEQLDIDQWKKLLSNEVNEALTKDPTFQYETDIEVERIPDESEESKRKILAFHGSEGSKVREDITQINTYGAVDKDSNKHLDKHVSLYDEDQNDMGGLMSMRSSKKEAPDLALSDLLEDQDEMTFARDLETIDLEYISQVVPDTMMSCSMNTNQNNSAKLLMLHVRRVSYSTDKQQLKQAFRDEKSWQEMIGKSLNELQKNIVKEKFNIWWYYHLYMLPFRNKVYPQFFHINFISNECIAKEQTKIKNLVYKKPVQADINPAKPKPTSKDKMNSYDSKRLNQDQYYERLSKGDNVDCDDPGYQLKQANTLKSSTKIGFRTGNLPENKEPKIINSDASSKLFIETYVDKHYLSCQYVKHPAPQFNQLEIYFIEVLVQQAKDTYLHITKQIEEKEAYAFIGSPFFDCGNHRLMNYPHKYQIGENKVKFRHYQFRDQKQAFNSQLLFKPEIINESCYASYIDELMGVANILCDGAIYTDRTAFLMLLSAITISKPNYLLTKEFLNPATFPFEFIMSELVFDFNQTPYLIKKLQSLTTNKEYTVYNIPSIFQIGKDNPEKISNLVQGTGSVIIEFVYYMHNYAYPQSHFVVLRENQFYDLQAMSMYRGVFNIPYCTKVDKNEKQLFQQLIYEMLGDEATLEGVKHYFQINIYQCSEKTQAPLSMLQHPCTFNYRVRELFTRFFFMYNIKDFAKCVQALSKGAFYVTQLVQLLNQDDASPIEIRTRQKDEKGNIQTSTKIYTAQDPTQFIYRTKVQELITQITSHFKIEDYVDTFSKYMEPHNPLYNPKQAIDSLIQLSFLKKATLSSQKNGYNEGQLKQVLSFIDRVFKPYSTLIKNHLPFAQYPIKTISRLKDITLQEYSDQDLSYELPCDLRVNLIDTMRNKPFLQKQKLQDLPKIIKFVLKEDEKEEWKQYESIRIQNEQILVKDHPKQVTGPKPVVPKHRYQYQYVYAEARKNYLSENDPYFQQAVKKPISVCSSFQISSNPISQVTMIELLKCYAFAVLNQPSITIINDPSRKIKVQLDNLAILNEPNREKCLVGNKRKLLEIEYGKGGSSDEEMEFQHAVHDDSTSKRDLKLKEKKGSGLKKKDNPSSSSVKKTHKDSTTLHKSVKIKDAHKIPKKTRPPKSLATHPSKHIGKSGGDSKKDNDSNSKSDNEDGMIDDEEILMYSSNPSYGDPGSFKLDSAGYPNSFPPVVKKIDGDKKGQSNVDKGSVKKDNKLDTHDINEIVSSAHEISKPATLDKHPDPVDDNDKHVQPQNDHNTKVDKGERDPDVNSDDDDENKDEDDEFKDKDDEKSEDGSEQQSNPDSENGGDDDTDNKHMKDDEDQIKKKQFKEKSSKPPTESHMTSNPIPEKKTRVQPKRISTSNAKGGPKVQTNINFLPVTTKHKIPHPAEESEQNEDEDTNPGTGKSSAVNKGKEEIKSKKGKSKSKKRNDEDTNGKVKKKVLS